MKKKFWSHESLPNMMTQNRGFEPTGHSIVEPGWRVERREALAREDSLDVMGKETTGIGEFWNQVALS